MGLPQELTEDRGLVPTLSGKYEELVREVVPLEPQDLEALDLAGPARSQDGLQHIRAYHHMIALRLASGERAVEICAAMSLTPQTITKLAKDPQFGQLVEHYRDKMVSKAVDHFELASMVHAETLLAMHERLVGEDRPTISFESLRRAYESTADRSGHSPVRRSEVLARRQVELSQNTIARIKEQFSEDTAYKAEALHAGVIEAHAEESANSGAGISIADAFEPLAEDAPDSDAGEGQDV